MLEYGICNVSLAPCRAEPSDRSEMVTQILFGEHLEVIAKEKSWAFIRNAYDNYEGWIDIKQYLPVSAETYGELNSAPLFLTSDFIQVMTEVDAKVSFPVTIGCHLPLFNNGICNLEGHEFRYEGSGIPFPSPDKNMVAETALSFLHAPYLWGGRSPLGIDCSGLVQIVYKLCGFKLPRDASQQALIGTVLSFPEEAEEGDIAFFDNEQGKITHTGIILRDGRIIHASGKVRIDKFDHYGIFNSETGSYSHHLRLIRKVI